MSQILTLPVELGPQGGSRLLTINDSSAVYSNVIAANYVAALQALGHVFYSGDLIQVNYANGQGLFLCSVDANNVATLAPFTQVGKMSVIAVNCGYAALASAGKVNIQVSSGSLQFKVLDVKVIYSSAGLSGGTGDRLLSITDGTTAYNGLGITAALLGTPVNTVWGGTGNPLPGSVALNTATVAGANLYAQYAGGTLDYTAGSVNLQVTLLRVA